MKVLWWGEPCGATGSSSRANQGLCLFYKRLERGRFVWPRAADGTVTLTPAQLAMLLEGIDWRQPRRTWQPEMAG